MIQMVDFKLRIFYHKKKTDYVDGVISTYLAHSRLDSMN